MILTGLPADSRRKYNIYRKRSVVMVVENEGRNLVLFLNKKYTTKKLSMTWVHANILLSIRFIYRQVVFIIFKRTHPLFMRFCIGNFIYFINEISRKIISNSKIVVCQYLHILFNILFRKRIRCTYTILGVFLYKEFYEPIRWNQNFGILWNYLAIL